MYSIKKNVLQLVSLLKKAGIRNYILCPGSRNIPLIQSIASVKEFHCTSVTDERSAGFYAIGQMQALGRPVAVCCTSGSAVLNLHPAVCEAYYQQLPLLVITADRPQEWIGQMDGQTLPQADAFGSLIRKSVILPEIKDNIEEWYCNRLINEALYSLTYPQNGPVQINVPISEPFFDFSENELPDERIIEHVQAESIMIPPQLILPLENSKRIMLIIGQRSYKEENITNILDICHEKGIVVIGEHLANIGTNCHFDEMLATGTLADDLDLCPDLVIYCGGHIVSKRLKHWIRKNPPRYQWWITTNDSMPDIFQHLTTTIQCHSPYLFLHMLLEKIPCKSNYESYRASKEKLMQSLNHSLWNKKDYCDITVLGSFVEHLNKQKIKDSASIQVANSSMVRNLQLFDLPDGIRTLCNRGVNGIEGSLSTAVGYALANKGLTFCLIGDLSFFYDMNALWHDHLPTNLRILLLNNNNGQIFHLLPHLQSPYLKKFISATHHFHAGSWAKECGMSYIRCNDADSLTNVWDDFFKEKSDKPILIEAVTDSKTDELIYKQYYNHLKQIQL